jgi:hypothetical protein
MPLPADPVAAARWARNIITSAFEARGLAIEANSVMQCLLDETERFEVGAQDLPALATANETDEAAVATGESLVRCYRLGQALELHQVEATPELTPTLETLGSSTSGNAEHEEQFNEAEYEIHSASQFLGHGQRVSFVNTRYPSRYQKRVEFMIGYKWPVECKRPRSRARIVPIACEAAAKIDERRQLGVVCVALENALPAAGVFREAMTIDDVRREVSENFAEFWAREQRNFDAVFAGGHVKYIQFNYSGLVYCHDNETINFPSLRIAVSSTGQWITTDVTAAVVQGLAALREAAQQ